jgi:hypothetical protein
VFAHVQQWPAATTGLNRRSHLNQSLIATEAAEGAYYAGEDPWLGQQ